MPVREAVEVALERGVDLVEVAPNAHPPVCRLLDYGRFRYEQSKKERELRKGQTTSELGEVRLRPKIGQHDVDFKTRQVRKLIGEGDKVKVSVIFRGRENTHPELAVSLLRRVAEAVQDISGVDVPPQLEGRGMSMILAPGKGRKNVAVVAAPVEEEVAAAPAEDAVAVAPVEEEVAVAPAEDEVAVAPAEDAVAAALAEDEVAVVPAEEEAEEDAKEAQTQDA